MANNRLNAVFLTFLQAEKRLRYQKIKVVQRKLKRHPSVKKYIKRNNRQPRERWTWNTKTFHETNYLSIHSRTNETFKRLYGNITKQMVLDFHEKIWLYFEPMGTKLSTLNKLLMWMYWMYQGCQISGACCAFGNISVSTGKKYIRQVPKAICKAYANSNIIGIPNQSRQRILSKILQILQEPIPESVQIIDGTHRLSWGRSQPQMRSFKWKWHAAHNWMFIIDRVLKCITCMSYSAPATLPDINQFRNHEIYRNLNVYFHEFFLLADKGYVGADPRWVCAYPKEGHRYRNMFNESQLKQMRSARVAIEHKFAHLFHNRFKQLYYWKRDNRDSNVEMYNIHTVAAIVMHNQFRIQAVLSINDMFDI